MYSHLPYRLCVGIALFNKDGKVFMGERLDNPGAWQMPQGGIDAGESVEDAAFRELFEEVGTEDAAILQIAPETICYDLPPERVPQFWDGRYRGQEQYWVAMRFHGADADIVLDAHSEPEFGRWQWVDLFKAPDLIVPFKRDVYRQIAALFEEFAGS
jgi:putative (di)nucleoside polyphosphate hydrolase